MASVFRVANFAARFCSELDNSENLVCSPLSVEIILALTALGSNGESRAEILKALDVTNEDDLRASYTSLTTTLDLKPTNRSKTRNVTLKMANKIYVKQGGALKSDLKNHAIEVFKSSLEQIDFTKSAAAASSINTWELDDKKNFICSPLSVENVLALTALGSYGESREEILKALDIPNDNTLRSSFTSLTKTLHQQSSSVSQTTQSKLKPETNLQTERDVTFSIANKIYVKQDAAVREDLKKDAVEVFRSSVEQIDFTKSSAAAGAINNWVQNQTNNTIKDLVSEDMLNEDTGLVLVNAIYFRGFWKNTFESDDTYTGKFRVDSTQEAEIKMMRMEETNFNFKRSAVLKAKILQMYYEGGKASMVMVLPNEVEGLKRVLQELSAGFDLMAEIKSLTSKRLNVVIPKFKVETEINLKELLPKMGIKTIFDKNKSDIKMLNSNERLCVSEAVQKAYIAVDELGTEAAAATGLRFQYMCAPWWDDEFIADHPFLFILLVHDIPIFYGMFQGKEN